MLYIIFYFSTLKWKKSVDDAVAFYDDGLLPSVLIQNKVDLLPSEEENNTDELNDFCKKNGFDGGFRTSAKTGKNISESMEFLIKTIIKKLEELSANGNDYKNERQSVTLDPDKHNKEADIKRKKDGGCCSIF